LALEWIYAEAPGVEVREPGLSAAASMTASAAAVPAQEAIQRLHELASMGHVQGLLAQLDHIDAIDEACRPFTAPLRQMAQDYDMRRIRASLKPFLEAEESQDDP